MYLRKEVRCPKCNALLEDAGITLTSIPVWSGVKCSSNLCKWDGYVREFDLYESNFKKVDYANQ